MVNVVYGFRAFRFFAGNNVDMCQNKNMKGAAHVR